MEFGGDVTIKWDFVIRKENSIRVDYTGCRIESNFGMHSRFRSRTIIVSEVFMNRTLG